jgi:hypothetical protein
MAAPPMMESLAESSAGREERAAEASIDWDALPKINYL